MPDMTKEEKHIDLVKTNLDLCNEVVRRAELANKGSRSHDINATMGQLKPLLKKLNKQAAKNVEKEELYKACKLRAHLCDALYLVSQHL